MFVHDGSLGEPPRLSLRIGGTPIGVGDRLKYLGIVLDPRWSFQGHFDRQLPKMEKAAVALSRIMPNLRGPDGRTRRLYAGAVSAIAQYGAPIWAAQERNSRSLRNKLCKAQRGMAQRLARAYRTVSRVAASVLEGIPPMDLVATMHEEVHGWRKRQLATRHVWPPPGAVALERDRARQRLVVEWGRRLADEIASDPTASKYKIVRAILPRLPEWLERGRRMGVTFRMTQILTGHGCFGHYLRRIERETTAACQSCPERLEDTAAHTLEVCSAWEVQRARLRAALGDELGLPAVVNKILDSREAWVAFASFCGDVMSQKEAAERERERGLVGGTLPLRPPPP